MDGIDSAGFEPYYYEIDETGAIKTDPLSGPVPEFTYNGLSPEDFALLGELTEIKNLLKQILDKL